MAVPVVVERPTLGEKAMLIASIAGAVFALAVLLYVLWLIFASVKATGFDADGVRCYKAASEMACLKTADPPR